MKKVNDLKRKNIVRVYLTDKGRQIYDEAKKRESILDILSGLSEKDSQQLASSLKEIRDEAIRALGIEDRTYLIGY